MTKSERFEEQKAIAVQDMEKGEGKMIILLTPYHGDDCDEEVDE